MMPPGIYSGFISHWSLDKKKKKKPRPIQSVSGGMDSNSGGGWGRSMLQESFPDRVPN
jgi:hypothetical protein